MPAPVSSADASAGRLADPPLLWRRWIDQRDSAAREQLIRYYLPYARMLAAMSYGRRTHNDIEFDDYLQLASIGLMEAVDRFDPAHGVLFRTFSSKRIQGSVLNGLVRLTEKNQQIAIRTRLRKERLESVKEAAADEHPGDEAQDAADTGAQGRSADALFRYLADVGVGLALGVLLEGTGMVDADAFDGTAQAPSPEISYFRKTELHQLQQMLRDHVDQLPAQQQLVIRYHYQQEIPFDEIARTMNVTRGRISQLHRQALLGLRERLSPDARCDVAW